MLAASRGRDATNSICHFMDSRVNQCLLKVGRRTQAFVGGVDLGIPATHGDACEAQSWPNWVAITLYMQL